MMHSFSVNAVIMANIKVKDYATSFL